MEPDRIIHLVSRLRDRANRDLQNELDRRRLGDLAPAHGGVLYALGAGPASMSDLAHTLERDNSTITTLVGRLERGGYVSRRPSEIDSRATLVELTARGRRARRVVQAAARATIGRFFREFTKKDRAELMRLLGLAFANLAGEGESAER